MADPAGLWWCLLALPIIALHILRPRRIQATVATLFLWRRVATPVTAASPWQRLTPSWLLAVQVLTALLLGLLLAQPARLTDELLAEHTVFVVDASGSMQATDGSPDRIASARETARDLRHQVPVGGRASLVVAGTDARAVLTDSEDADAFDDALRSIEAVDGAGDVAGAFAIAAGLDTGDVEIRVVFVSDGGIGDADLRAAPRRHPLCARRLVGHQPSDHPAVGRAGGERAPRPCHGGPPRWSAVEPDGADRCRRDHRGRRAGRVEGRRGGKPRTAGAGRRHDRGLPHSPASRIGAAKPDRAWSAT